jgi:predicted DCC family thiol-disulfide oxidoreductase YuxK
VFLYDGDCAFCTSCARVIERRIPTRAGVVAWQHADLDDLGVTEGQAQAAVLWVAPRGGRGRRVDAGADAVARLLVDAGSWWRVVGWVLGHPPVLWVARPVYRLVARNRHRLPGGTPACRLPAPEPGAAHHHDA